ncbi:MAG: hypothetical protein M3R27_05015 [Bacteroidota bacterium]|nr:hypothetical protein [Bacteroidota bacterium]
MTDTTIYLGTFPIHEPMTAFTDLIITFFGLLFFYRLRKASSDITTRSWSIFFLLIGISTFFGACAHGFFAVHDGWEYKSVWLPMQIINAVSLYYAQQATLHSVLNHSPSRNIWKWSYIIQLLIYIVCLMIFQKYIVTIIENAITLIPIMILHYRTKEKVAGSRMIANGITVSFITAVIHGTKLSLHAYFNFNDLAHVFIFITLWMMYSGAKKNAIS